MQGFRMLLNSRRHALHRCLRISATLVAAHVRPRLTATLLAIHCDIEDVDIYRCSRALLVSVCARCQVSPPSNWTPPPR